LKKYRKIIPGFLAFLVRKREDESQCPNLESKGLPDIVFHEKRESTGKEVRSSRKEKESSETICLS
jgi:hypothetical protein